MAYEATYRNTGMDIEYTPSGAAVVAGQVVVLSELVAIAKADIADGALGALTIEGVFDVAKTASAGITFSQGDIVYWDADNNVATSTAGSNKIMGKAVKAAVNADTSVRVKLTPQMLTPDAEATTTAA